MNKLTYEQIPDLALGAKLMGGGGGGDPYIAQLMALEAIRACGPVCIWSVDEVPDDALVVAVGMMGGTTVFAERLPSDKEATQAVRAIEQYLGRTVNAIITYEMAGMNGVLPLISAARLRLPFIDGDLSGRAIPGLHMTLATANAIRATPMVLVDSCENQIVLDTPDNHRTEILARSIVMDLGGAAQLAFYPMKGSQLKRVVLAGSLSRMLRVGQGLRQAREKKQDPLPAIRSATNGVEIFRGKVTQVHREWKIRYDYSFGDSRVEGANIYLGQEMALNFQNEYLIAAVGRHLITTVPDNIIVLEARTTEPIPPEFLVCGMDLIILGLPCAEGWRTKDGLAILGPRAFGYDVDYCPLDHLYK